MQKITPFLWYDTRAEEAARFYVAAFEDSRLGSVTRYDGPSAEASGQPEGSTMTVSFELEGLEFVALNGGPLFKPTPAISFFVSCDTADEVDALHATLSDGGSVLMPLQEYPFSERYCWLSDRYGVSWQLSLAPAEQKITPSLMFVGEHHGKAEEAMALYTSLFENSGVKTVARYGPDDPDPAEGTVKYAEFFLDGQRLRAMDSSFDHDFTFTEAVSLQIACEDQEEVDHFWNALTEEGEESRCGWLKDPYGVSWQVVPSALPEMLRDEDAERAERVTRALLGMKKLEIRELEQAFQGEGGKGRSDSDPTSPGSISTEAPRPVSRFALGVLALSVAPAVLGAMAGFGTRWGLWSFGTGFTLLRWAAYGGIAVLALAVAAILHTRPGGARRGLWAGVLAFALGAVTVGIPWANLRTARSAPPIHDITTDTGDPPEFVAVAPLRAEAPNPVAYPGEEVARQQREAYPDLRPAVLDVGFERAFERALATAEDQGWQIVEADLDQGRIEATDRTFWFGFTDDIVIRVTPLEGRSLVDVRSKSRVGRGDVGTNADRIRDYLTNLTS